MGGLTVYEGTAVRATGRFTNASTATVDPTTITLKWKIGSGSTTTWIYGTGTNISRVARGVYRATIPTTTATGTAIVEWIGTGTCEAVNVSTFRVKARAL